VTGYTTQWFGNFTLTHISATAPGSEIGTGPGTGDAAGAVPEPGTLALDGMGRDGMGLFGLAGMARNRRGSQA